MSSHKKETTKRHKHHARKQKRPKKAKESSITSSEQENHEEKEEALIEEGLGMIYGDDEIDFSKFEKSRNRLTSILTTIVVTLGVVAVLGWLTFFIYSKYIAPEDPATFEIEIEAPEEVVSGDTVEFVVRYSNPAAHPITGLEIDLQLPLFFDADIMQPMPTDANELIWMIGNLSPGSDGEIRISGVWFASDESSLPIQVLANYKPANFNADFQELATSYILTTESLITVSFDGPEEATPGKELDYTVFIENAGEQDFSNIDVDLTLPEGFYLGSSNPEIEAGTPPEWHYDTLLAGEIQEIHLSGSFTADIEGFQYFDVVASIATENQLLVQREERGFTDVLGSGLNLNLIADGSTGTVATEPGEMLHLTVSLENTGDTDLADATILLDFSAEDPLPIDWDISDLGEARLTAEGVFFSEDLIETIEPAGRRIFNLKLYLDDVITDAQADTFTVVAVVDHADIEIRSQEIRISLNSDASFSSSARYYTDDGAALGSGPMPPRIGETTSYRIFWTVENSLHDLEEVKITATLPPSVSWMSLSSAELGDISFDEETNIVTWSIASIPNDIPRVEANFSLSITPDTDDLNSFVTLLSGSILKATDSVTEEYIEETTNSLSSELLGDDTADGEGIVVEG
jgi:uncharacterized repeat protein (TIGR01451 family)